jgi:ABC-type dipeptide/oligopeptide/nickel transport system permease component
VTGNWAAFKDTLLHLCCPPAPWPPPGGASHPHDTLQIIEVLSEKYILAARITGLPRRHPVQPGLKNAIIPTITVLGLSLPIHSPATS